MDISEIVIAGDTPGVEWRVARDDDLGYVH